MNPNQIIRNRSNELEKSSQVDDLHGSKHLYVSSSDIEGAGQGAFMSHPVEADSFLCWYTDPRSHCPNLEDTCPETSTAYPYHDDDARVYRDAWDPVYIRPTCLAAFVNDTLRLRTREYYDPQHLDKRWDSFCIIPFDDHNHGPRVEQLDDIASQSDVAPQSDSRLVQAAIQVDRVLQRESLTDIIGSLTISTNTAVLSHVSDLVVE